MRGGPMASGYGGRMIQAVVAGTKGGAASIACRDFLRRSAQTKGIGLWSKDDTGGDGRNKRRCCEQSV